MRRMGNYKDYSLAVMSGAHINTAAIKPVTLNPGPAKLVIKQPLH